MIKKKQVWIESLRIFALFWVLYDHTGGYGYLLHENTDIVASSAEKVASMLLCSFCRISVPMFLTISGALLLGRNEPMKKNLKRISRMAILIIVTAVANYVYFRTVHHEYANNIHSILDFVKELYGGTNLCTYYLWLYLGFLICLPLLQEIAKRRELLTYSAILYVVIVQLLPLLELRFSWPSFNLKTYGGFFAVYYICPLIGYWIESSGEIFTRKILLGVNGLAVISFALNTWIGFWSWNVYGTTWLLLPTVLAACLFYDAKYFSRSAVCARLCEKRFYPALEKVILVLSPQTLGAFLLSGVLMWKVFPVYTYLQATASGTFAALVWALASMLVCQAITAVLRLIPFMKKLL